MDCIFCKIVNGELPAEKVYETDQVLAFRDIHPKAPQHVLVIPKTHLPSILDFDTQDATLVAAVIRAIQDIANQIGVAQDGFRVITNTGAGAGQIVNHVHFHILGGK